MLRARRLEAAALGLGGLARIAVGEDVGLRGSDSTEHGEERSNEFSPQKRNPDRGDRFLFGQGLGPLRRGG